MLLVEQFEPGHDRGRATGRRASSGSRTRISTSSGSRRAPCRAGASSRRSGASRSSCRRGRSTSGPSRSRMRARSPRPACGTSCSRTRRCGPAGRSRPSRASRSCTTPTRAHPGGARLGAPRRGSRRRGRRAARERRVTGIAAERGSVRVDDRGDEIVARACVVAAGAWARGLLDGAGVELPVIPTRETVTYFDLPGPLDASARDRRRRARPGGARAPPPRPDQLRARRPRTRSQSRSAPRRPAHRSRRARRGRRGGRALGLVLGREALPGALPEPIGAETCIYTNTADESFVLERHGRIVVASACSGHGFKFAPLFGRTLAGLARDAAG